MILTVSYRANTSPKAAFTGSMQLLAGVKLCTGRPITNHPHYEDKALRRRTKEVNASLSFRSYFSNVFHAGLANFIPLCGLSIAFNFRRFSGFIKSHSFCSIVTYHSCYMELLSLTSVDFCCLHIWSAVNFVTVVDVELRWSVMQSVATCIIKSYFHRILKLPQVYAQNWHTPDSYKSTEKLSV